MARVAALHAKWIRAAPKGALSPECQELNALHSKSVDGARIKIPDRLKTPPEPLEEYIIDSLAKAALKFRTEFNEARGTGRLSAIPTLDRTTGYILLQDLLRNPRAALTEYDLFNLAMAFSRKNNLNHEEIMTLLSQLDWSALAATEKHVITSTLNLDPWEYPQIWNSLFTSDLIGPRELSQRNLTHPMSMQRLFSSKHSGIGPFWRYLRQTTQNFTRKLILIQVYVSGKDSYV